MKESTKGDTLNAFLVTHPLDPEDAPVIARMRDAARTGKGVRWTIGARPQYDALLERVQPPHDVTFESGHVGGIAGLWVRPGSSPRDAAIMHCHGGWFNAGSASAYRHFVGHIATKTGANAFVPEYRLAPEHPFPAAVDDVWAAYRGMADYGIRRIAVTGDSAGGNLALVLASRVAADTGSATPLVAVALVGFQKQADCPVMVLTEAGKSASAAWQAGPGSSGTGTTSTLPIGQRERAFFQKTREGRADCRQRDDGWRCRLTYIGNAFDDLGQFSIPY